MSRACAAEAALYDVYKAIHAHENGDFTASAKLVDNMMRDPIIAGLLSSRIRTALSATFTVVPSTASPLRELADIAAAEAESFMPRLMAQAPMEATLASVLMMGFGPSQAVWDNHDRPMLDIWEPGSVSVRWLPDVGYQWQTQTTAGPVEIDDVDARWLLVVPGGRSRGWLDGMVRSLGIPWIQAQFAIRDWLRASERHGTPVFKAKMPSAARAEDKRQYVSDVSNLGNSGTVGLPQGVDQANSFDLELLEMTGNSAATFKGLLDDAYSKITKRILGTDAEAQPGGLGSGAADAGESQRIAIARGDATALATAIREQVLRPWAYWRYGDADLAPEIHVQLETPAEKEAQARLLLAGAQAIKALQDAGVAVDAEAYARKLGVDMLADRVPPAKEFFAYHLEYGIPTVNEVRATLGLAPRDGGDEPTKPPALPGGDPFAMTSGIVAADATAEPTPAAEAPIVDVEPVAALESAPPTYQARRARAVAAVEYSDKVVAATRAELVRAVKPDVDMLLRELGGATDYADAHSRILAFYENASDADIVAALGEAGELVNVVGLHSERDEGAE